MKKLITSTLILYAMLAFSQEQNDNQHQPVPCGTGRIMEMQREEYKKIIQDFISYAQKDFLFGNGIWEEIPPTSDPKTIVKKAIHDWDLDEVTILDSEDLSHILIAYKNQKYIVLYQNDLVRLYDAFWYKNNEHPEVINLWKTDLPLFFKKKNKQILLTLSADTPYFLDLKDDYTFKAYTSTAADCENSFEGRYYFRNGKIGFVKEYNPKCKDKNNRPLEFKYKKENDTIVLAK